METVQAVSYLILVTHSAFCLLYLILMYVYMSKLGKYDEMRGGSTLLYSMISQIYEELHHLNYLSFYLIKNIALN